MTEGSGQDCMAFQEFRRIVAEELQIEEERVVRSASFVEDLLADSIKLMELMLRMEERGFRIPVESAWEVETVGDAYRLFSERSASQE